MSQVAQQIAAYWYSLDKALEILSAHQEGKITGLPDWALTPREITVGVSNAHDLVVLKVTPNETLEQDRVTALEVTSDADIARVLHPWRPSFTLQTSPHQVFIMMGGLQRVRANPLVPPAFEERSIIGWGSIENAINSLSEPNAKKNALELWNAVVTGLPATSSFVNEAIQVFRKFQAIVKRKAFKERRIHRFINEHQKLLLPSFRKCFYEVVLRLEGEVRKADFILQREETMPALLIELESPSSKAFRKNGEPTAEANHACGQIAEWIKFIDSNPQENASGEFKFLIGPKQRLVIISRGLEPQAQMLDSRYRDTLIWTYDLLLDQAKKNWNHIINTQCRLIGLKELSPF